MKQRRVHIILMEFPIFRIIKYQIVHAWLVGISSIYQFVFLLAYWGIEVKNIHNMYKYILRPRD